MVETYAVSRTKILKGEILYLCQHEGLKIGATNYGRLAEYRLEVNRKIVSSREEVGPGSKGSYV